MNAAKSHRRLIVAAAVLAGAGGLAVALALGADGHGAPPSTTATGGLPLHESGRGDGLTPAFTTAAHWTLRYTYTCLAGGTLRVLEDDPGRDGLPLLDATGHGAITVYVHDERGPHVLRTTTNCTWALTVTNGEGAPGAASGPVADMRADPSVGIAFSFAVWLGACPVVAWRLRARAGRRAADARVPLPRPYAPVAVLRPGRSRRWAATARSRAMFPRS